jgi:hypothetical protein
MARYLSRTPIHAFIVFLVGLALVGCSENSDDPALVSDNYAIDGKVEGLTGSIVLLNNLGNPLTVIQSFPFFTFTSGLSVGASYNVTIGAHPLDQICVITNGNGTIGSTHRIHVGISCHDNAFHAYSVGNSLTWDSQPDGVAALAASQNIGLSVGYHIQPGQPLSFSTTNPHPSDPAIAALQIKNLYGTFENALGNNTWSFVSIQPYLTSSNASSTLGSDIAAINLLIALTEAGPSSDVRYFIYEGWPNTPSWSYPALSTDTYATTWDAPSIDATSTPTALSRQYFNNLFTAAKAGHPENQIFVIPVGSVLSALDREISAGHIAGLDSIYDIYRDSTHLTLDVGRFVAATTVYATYFKTSPVGLPVPSGFYTSNGQPNGLPSRLATDTVLRDQLEQIVWDVVSNDPRAGIAPIP